MSTVTKEKATPEEAELIRRVMSHSKQTANRFYVRTKLTKVGAEVVKIIARVTAPDGEHNKKEEVDEDTEKIENPRNDAPGTSGIVSVLFFLAMKTLVARFSLSFACNKLGKFSLCGICML